MLPLQHKLAAELATTAAPPPGAHLLVAVSGGPDSTALLVALAETARYRLTAAYVDHGLRGSEGAREQAAVAALAHRLGASFVSTQVGIFSRANLEAVARRARYRSLRALARAQDATCVVTGHTQDDQAETVLLRLLRGTGRRGLGGIRRRRGLLWRPFLAVSRADVRRFLGERGVDFAVDRSNADLCHTRNRVRRLVLPFLSAEFNPNLSAGLARFAQRTGDEDEVLSILARTRLAALRSKEGLATAVCAEPPAIGRRIVRLWLAGQGYRINATHVERVLSLAAAAVPGTASIPGPARVVREAEVLVCRPGRSPEAMRFCFDLEPGKAIDGPGGWHFELSAVRPATPEDGPTLGPERALFDADALPPELVLRSPAPGDRLRVLGGRTRKLQDILVDAKVPREARQKVPVLVGAGHILWVGGVVRAHGARIAPGTRRVVEGLFLRKI